MKAFQLSIQGQEVWDFSKLPEQNYDYQLIIVFGSRYLLEGESWFDALSKRFPQAQIISASTSGNIHQESVTVESLVANFIYFEKTEIRTVAEVVTNPADSFRAGLEISRKLTLAAGKEEDGKLRHILVFSDGSLVNGSDLVRGLSSGNIPVTGGLAGDDARFEKTLVGLNALPSSGNIVGIGFYGSHLSVGYGHFGGWDSFGPQRLVTRSNGNVLYEVDGKSALDLYKTYLGEKASELPGSALLFPLSMKETPDSEPLTRTILSIREDGGMVFAGEIPQGSVVQLMKANFERLIDASSMAAGKSIDRIREDSSLALLISCVGRKLVLGQRVEEEVEAVRDVLGAAPLLTGFYSYGEISTQYGSTQCELHNQTMTITLLKED